MRKVKESSLSKRIVPVTPRVFWRTRVDEGSWGKEDWSGDSIYSPLE